jgi:hypothetical protein
MNHQEIERLAYRLWQERGMPFGSPDEDWFFAEQLLRRRYQRSGLSMPGMSLAAFGMGKRTR